MIVFTNSFKNSNNATTMNIRNKYELIVVFKKGVEEKSAIDILNKLNVKFENRSDSSRGKVYFYNNGPQLLLVFNSQEDLEKSKKELKDLQEVFELYIPDWKIQKD
jgi:hypothetical protein